MKHDLTARRGIGTRRLLTNSTHTIQGTNAACVEASRPSCALAACRPGSVLDVPAVG